MKPYSSVARLVASVLPLTLSLGWATPAAGDSARAAEADTGAVAGTPEERAREHYARGAAAFEAGRFLEAVREFELAARQVDNPALAYNIALAYDSMGETAKALRHYRDYLRRVPEAADEDEVRASIRRLERALEQLGMQQVTVLSTPEGASVTLDGEVVGKAPWTGETTAGAHRVEVEAPGYAPSVAEFTLPEDRAIDVKLVLTEATLTRRAATEQSDGRGKRERGAPARIRPSSWIVLGAGAATLGAAAVLERSRAAAEDDARASEVQVDADAAYDTMQKRQLAARLCAGGGAALVTVGAVLVTVNLRSSRNERAPRTALACGGDGCMLTAGGRF